MSKSVVMAEYQGRCDTAGTAVGHAPKVMREYGDMLAALSHDVAYYAPAVILKAAGIKKDMHYKKLDHHILMKGKNSLAEKIFNKFRMFANISECLKADADVIWFFNTEFYFFLYIAIFGNRGRNVYANSFIGDFGRGFAPGIKRRIFERAQKRIGGMISTGASFSFKNTKSIFIPDYSYDPEVYDRFRTEEKEDVVVCLGTMSADKKLEEMVEAFNKNGYPLKVVGRFYDKERFEKLKRNAAANIEIRDEYPERDEYLTLLGSARFVVLPYPEEKYSMQTSGVLQEAVFLDTIPLTQKAILEGNKIPGGGYVNMDEIAEVIKKLDEAELKKSYAALREVDYDKTAFAKKLDAFLDGGRQ